MGYSRNKVPLHGIATGIKTRVILTIILSATMLGGCTAGAGTDFKHSIVAAERYPAYLAPKLSETVITHQPLREDVSQHFEDILRTFKSSIQLEQDAKAVILPSTGLEMSFKNQVLLVKKAGAVMIQERLPSVFYMRPLSLGIDRLGGVPVMMVVNGSRATTGLRFVAIYAEDGTPLYKRVLSSGDVWDIKLNTGSLDIMNPIDTRRIVWK